MTEGKNIKFRIKVPVSFPRVYADENRLIQILFNLIHNAVKFTREGSITIHATYENDEATIYIQDTGIGMSEETMQQIFEPYTQENASITSVGTGIGLGLHVCKQLITNGGLLSSEW